MKLKQDIYPSSATRLIRSLARQGVERDEITQDMVLDAYETHRSARAQMGYPPPDFEAARATMAASDLPDASCDTSWDDPVMGIIFETRKHKNLVPVVEEVLHGLGLRVQIFHARENADYIRNSALAEAIEAGDIVLTELEITTGHATFYNALHMLPEFWQAVKGRGKILLFQTDVVFCPASPYALSDFLEFDYIGPPHWQSGEDGLIFHGGIGGLTLRSWDVTMACFERFPPEAWPGAEDKYFSFHVDLIGTVGRFQDCARFCSQNRMLTRSFAAHKPTVMNPVDVGQLLRFCPQAERVTGNKVPDRRPLARSAHGLWKTALWSAASVTRALA